MIICLAVREARNFPEREFWRFKLDIDWYGDRELDEIVHSFSH